MSTWNYRVLRRPMVTLSRNVTTDPYYEIIEAYYNEAGEIDGYAEKVSPYGDTVEDLQADLNRMLEATTKPVLDLEDVGEKKGNGRE